MRTDVEVVGELGMIDGALHIPLEALRGRMDEVPTDKPVTVICRSGRRSAMATQILRKADLDAANINGGMLRWRDLDLPLG